MYAHSAGYNFDPSIRHMETKSSIQRLITTLDRNDGAGTAPFHVLVYLMILNCEETAFLAFGGYGC